MGKKFFEDRDAIGSPALNAEKRRETLQKTLDYLSPDLNIHAIRRIDEKTDDGESGRHGWEVDYNGDPIGVT